MAFFPFAMASRDFTEAMQSCFQHANQNSQPYRGMGIPMMAQAQAQAGHHWQRPYFSSQHDGQNDDDIFHVELDVQHFAPEEISVKMIGNQVVIEGNHDTRESGRTSAARHFIHHYSVPEIVKFEDITSSLSSDGVLTISAPKAQSKKETNERSIPITPTGLPAKKPASGDPSSTKSNGESKD